MDGANVFDIVIVVLLAWSAFRGFSKGIISAIASLGALLFGIWGAIQFSKLTAVFLADFIHVEERVMGIIAFAVTFVGIVIGVHFVAKLTEKLLEAVALSFINKMFGALFGTIKILFIASVVLFFVNAANSKMSFLSQEFQDTSVFYKPISNIAPRVFNYLEINDVQV